MVLPADLGEVHDEPSAVGDERRAGDDGDLSSSRLMLTSFGWGISLRRGGSVGWDHSPREGMLGIGLLEVRGSDPLTLPCEGRSDRYRYSTVCLSAQVRRTTGVRLLPSGSV